MTRSRAALIMAAGFGTRMKSTLAKPLHKVGGLSMLDWALDLADAVKAHDKVVIWGAHSPAVKEAAEARGARAALQDPPQGTGHAVQCAQSALQDFDGNLIVLCGDTPLIQAETIEAVFQKLEEGTDIVAVGFEPDEPGSYGRLIVAENGTLEAIVEAKDASPAQLAVRLCNAGLIAGSAKLVFELLSHVTNDNAKGEYYLTDVVGLARQAGKSCAVVTAPAEDILGVNSRRDLAQAEAAFQVRMRNKMMDAGVTLMDPASTFFSYDTEVANDVVVEPHVVFGPGVKIGTGTTIKAFSHVEGAVIGQNADIGPYARLRPGTKLDDGVKIGNFVETKKAAVGKGAKVNHLSYIGDAEIGAKANIGAGTITCNYDGFDKHKTIIGEGAFIGSNSALVAPVTIGAGAFTGSGAVITKDVPEDALALARAHQEVKTGWAVRFRAAKAARKEKKPTE
ncbi:bifunctional UDP-N-acetylglucosamine diphosphorylase/glucosamine-1-phosphate N-acetyltransferase GlmU [Woodsholea maritima]|uniref:bifunctional UDP-N-acetylglucosamine diphosphorylase/glucosamine-1-phosphate N-acetyltransferase GlmU n=1 Tax=Woodsholea maritima TaxID=240237 RepID=UPI00036DFDA0|nr:bifunctional UDP-N-acetylglucosamine diphosphorylase/glucosamine-1-phosphate N-acetyltransferase GlmU [Woodsholea maritima]